MYILGTVCARGGSKGVPHKNIKMMGKYPLIAYSIAHAAACELIDDTIISTDDVEIAHVCRKLTTVQMRPAELATDEASKWDVFRYILKDNPCDVLVDLDTGCPLRDPEDITACIAKLDEGYDVVCTAYESERNPYFNMVEVKEGYCELPCWNYFDEHPTITRRQDAPKVYSISPSVFAIRSTAVFEYEHWSQARLGIVEIPRLRGLDIDTQDDWDYVEWLMTRKND